MILFLLQHGSEISLLLRVISVIQILFFVLPLQVKEYAVRNGLISLRQQLLFFGVILFLSNVVSTFFLINVIISVREQQLTNILLQIFNAASFLILSTIGNLIYHSQYSEESKDFHAQIADDNK
jgi:hypothetical protein